MQLWESEPTHRVSGPGSPSICSLVAKVTVGHGPIRYPLNRTYLEHPRFFHFHQNPRFFEIFHGSGPVRNGPEWSGPVRNGPEWSGMGPEWVRMGPEWIPFCD